MSADCHIHRNPAGEAAATSGMGGRVVAGGADASAVIQRAIDSLPAEGGRITIAAGTWDLTSTVTIEDQVLELQEPKTVHRSLSGKVTSARGEAAVFTAHHPDDDEVLIVVLRSE